MKEMIHIAYVPVPKDLNSVKTKVLFNLTKRQLICFGAGLGVGLPMFFLCRSVMGNSAAAIVMILIMLPFMLLAMYEKHGQPLEVVVKNIIQVCFIRPKVRPFMTDNFYDILERQSKLDEEVQSIVYQEKAHAGRQKADRSGNRKSEKQRQA